MQVSHIRIVFRRIDPSDRREEALIQFHAPEKVLQILAHAPRTQSAAALLRDALRQLRRLPEFRSGQERPGFERIWLHPLQYTQMPDG